MFLFFTVKIHPLHPDPLPPLGGEGMIFMSGGDQIPVMMVCDSNSGVRLFSRAWPDPTRARGRAARAHENIPIGAGHARDTLAHLTLEFSRIARPGAASPMMARGLREEIRMGWPFSVRRTLQPCLLTIFHLRSIFDNIVKSRKQPLSFRGACDEESQASAMMIHFVLRRDSSLRSG